MKGDKWEPAWGGGMRPDITGEVASINLDAIAIFCQKIYSSIILKHLNNIVWFFSDSFLVSKCCDLLLELANLRVLAKTHKVQKSKGNDRIMKKFWIRIIYGMIWMWLKFGDDRVTGKTLATRPDPHPPPLRPVLIYLHSYITFFENFKNFLVYTCITLYILVDPCITIR